MKVTYDPEADALYLSFRESEVARQAVAEHGALPVPLKIRNAPTQLMKDLGYGEGYLPDELAGAKFYEPNPIAAEKKIKDLLEKRWGKGE